MKPKTAGRQTRDTGERKEGSEVRGTRDKRAERRHREAEGRQSVDRGQALDHGDRADKEGAAFAGGI